MTGALIDLSPRRYSFELLCLGFGLRTTSACCQKYNSDDPTPPGAHGNVLPVQAKVLQIRGLALGVVGKT